MTSSAAAVRILLKINPGKWSCIFFLADPDKGEEERNAVEMGFAEKASGEFLVMEMVQASV